MSLLEKSADGNNVALGVPLGSLLDFVPGAVQSLISATECLTKAAYLQGFARKTSFLAHEIEMMFTRFKFGEPLLIRIYVDGGQRFGLTERFISRASRPHRGFERYLRDCVGADKFCVTLNGLSKWSEPFECAVQQELLQPLFTELGNPYGGCDFYAFIGNYGYTPFGIHDDDDHSILLHLGPGTKTVYFWRRADYTQVVGNAMTTINFRPLLRTGVRYELSPGDLLFIPKGDFHILNTPAFSITLGLTIFPSDTAGDVRQAIEQLDLRENKDAFFASPDNYFTRAVHPEMTLSVGDMVRSRRLALCSNGFITTLPISLPHAASIVAAARVANKTFSLQPYHPILLREWQSYASMFIRGQRIDMCNIPGIRRFVAFLQDRPTFTVKDIVDHMIEAWDESLTEMLLTKIMEARGLAATGLRPLD